RQSFFCRYEGDSRQIIQRQSFFVVARAIRDKYSRGRAFFVVARAICVKYSRRRAFFFVTTIIRDNVSLGRAVLSFQSSPLTSLLSNEAGCYQYPRKLFRYYFLINSFAAVLCLSN